MKLLKLSLTLDEYEWVRHAASLKSLSPHEYAKRAINAQLCREGVDAVLIRQSDDESAPPAAEERQP